MDSHPIAICNGDVLFIDIIAEECKNIDVFGTNMYRGSSFTDAFKTVKGELRHANYADRVWCGFIQCDQKCRRPKDASLLHG